MAKNADTPQDPNAAARVAQGHQPLNAEVSPPPMPGDVLAVQGTHPADVPPPAAAAPVPPAVEPDTPGFDPDAAPHPFPYVDPEIAERQERIAELEEEIAQAEREERIRLVAADKALTIANLDDQEAALRAQLARVRGEDPVSDDDGEVPTEE